MSKFFFANEKPCFNSFFLVAARRAAILFPVAGVISISAISLIKLLVLIFWLLSGNWKSRIEICKRNPILWVLILLICWTFIGVIRWIITDYNMTFEALKHWWSHYSFFCMLILITLYYDKSTRIKSLTALNFAMLIFCINFLLVYNNLWIQTIPSCFILFNTISIGVALVIWCVLWIHYPFQSRNIPLFRRILPVSILLGMKAASRTSPLDLFLALIQLGIKKRLPICGIIFALLRWSIVAAIIYFVFVLNPSRTAQLSLLLVIISGIIMWNRRKGIIVTIIVTACILPIAMTNKTFVHKWQRTYTAVADFVKQDANAVKISHKDRHWILAKIIPEIKKKPIAGHGLDLNFKTVQSILEFSPNRGFIHTHCEFTQIAIQNGLAGMGFFIIFLLMTFVYSAKITSPINRFAVSIMLIVFIDLLFNVPLYFGRQKILTIFVIAAVISEISFYLQYKTNLKFRNIRKITNE